MPNFKPHFVTGATLAVTTSLVTSYLAYEVTRNLTGTASGASVAFLFTLVSSLAPDVDHHKSYVFRFVKGAIYTASIAVILYLEYIGWDILINTSSFLIKHTKISGISPTALSLLLAFVLLSTISELVLEAVDQLRPKHRGITHSKKANLVFSILLFFVTYLQPVIKLSNIEPWLLAAIVSASWISGSINHILLDWIK